MSDRKLPNCAQKARRKPQTAAVSSLSGTPGPSEACLMRRTMQDRPSEAGIWEISVQMCAMRLLGRYFDRCCRAATAIPQSR
jgi:hypothetical protein